ncbi:hypothetical protein KP509_29G029900 [Ceratopteris richardii]|uniref:Pentatricopeptide repeat-containing protein n=1 Tax=Ceratopteris richardii TaxID=49495 RepID=A0A8T2R5P4_CERRI|nr:hypothetical protein KP509_29G029900 [Ceratopteris richardii]
MTWYRGIQGYCHHGHGKEAIICFEKLQKIGPIPDVVTYRCVLNACNNVGAIIEGKKVHAEVMRRDLLRNEVALGNSLVDMYAKCGLHDKAHTLFDRLEILDAISWTTLITIYIKYGFVEEALPSFKEMCHKVHQCQEIHVEIIKDGTLLTNKSVYTTLVETYASWGMLREAHEVFYSMPKRDVVVWTTLMEGYAQQRRVVGLLGKATMLGNALAQEIFDQFPVHELVSWNTLMIGYCQHGHGKEAIIWNSLVEMYAKCGLRDKAHTLFDKLEILDAVSWTALITVTSACILKACSIIGAVHQCQEIHVEIIKDGTLLTNKPVYTTLVETYASCGMLREAQKVFDSYAQLGEVDIVFDLLYKMERDGIKPNMITSIVVLNSCTHNGLLKEGGVDCQSVAEEYANYSTRGHSLEKTKGSEGRGGLALFCRGGDHISEQQGARALLDGGFDGCRGG